MQPTNESTRHLFGALLRKVHWWDYPVFILWIGALYFNGYWWASFSNLGYLETTAATYGSYFFVFFLLVYPVLRIGLHYALKGRKKNP
jgi:hypothetical protein